MNDQAFLEKIVWTMLDDYHCGILIQRHEDFCTFCAMPVLKWRVPRCCEAVDVTAAKVFYFISCFLCYDPTTT